MVPEISCQPTEWRKFSFSLRAAEPEKPATDDPKTSPPPDSVPNDPKPGKPAPAPDTKPQRGPKPCRGPCRFQSS